MPLANVEEFLSVGNVGLKSSGDTRNNGESSCKKRVRIALAFTISIEVAAVVAVSGDPAAAAETALRLASHIATKHQQHSSHDATRTSTATRAPLNPKCPTPRKRPKPRPKVPC